MYKKLQIVIKISKSVFNLCEIEADLRIDNTKPRNEFLSCFILEKYCVPEWLVGFSDISTLEGYLKPNPIYIDIKYIWFVNQ